MDVSESKMFLRLMFQALEELETPAGRKDASLKPKKFM